MSLPAALLPYQQRIIRDKAPVRIIEKSRRVGVSWDLACEAVLTSAAADGMDTWYVGYNREMAEEFIRDTADWAKRIEKIAADVEETTFNDGEKDILAFVIRFASGYRVTALSSRPANLRGKQGHVIIDEAAFHDGLGELLKAAMALLMWGGRVTVVSTHNGVDNKFNELVQDTRGGRTKYSLHRITLDDALKEGLFQRICLRLRKPWSPKAEAGWRDELISFYRDGYEEELFCVPRNSSGAFIPRSIIERQMFEAPVFRLELPDSFLLLPEIERIRSVDAWCEENIEAAVSSLPMLLPHVFGFDFGRSGDLSALAPMTIEQRLTRRVPFMVEMRNVPFAQQKQVLFYVVDRLPGLLAGAMDRGVNGAWLAEETALKYGPRVEPTAINLAWYGEHFPRLKASFEDGRIWVPRDAFVLEDLRVIQIVKNVPRIPEARKGGPKQQRHGDDAVAIALAHYASQQEPEEYGYEPIYRQQGRGSDWDDEDDDLPSARTSGYRAGRGVY